MTCIGGRRRDRPKDSNGDPADGAGRDESGFSLVEVLCASAILVLLVVSFSNMLTDSLRVALVTKQSELAASVASDMIENAKAIGQSALAPLTAGTLACTAQTYGSATVPVPVPVRTTTTNMAVVPPIGSITQCFTIYVDSYSYTVTPTLTSPPTNSPQAEAISVQVTWGSGTTTGSYTAYGLIGQ